MRATLGIETVAGGWVSRRLLPARRSAKRQTIELRPFLEPVEARTLLATQPLMIAALGDSLTDEYAVYGAFNANDSITPTAGATTLPPQIYLTGRDAARNWDMILSGLRSSQISFGPYSTVSRNATRNQGYLENWALQGTTAAGPNISGSGTTFAEEYEGIPAEFNGGFNPTPGLLTQNSNNGVPIQDINVVTILIGGNDYVNAVATLASGAGGIGAAESDANVFTQANQNIESAISSAVSAIQTASPNTKIVIMTTPDITVTPVIQDLAGSDIGLLKIVVGAAIDSLDSDIESTYSGNANVGIINTTALIDQFASDPVIDGVTVNMEGAGQNDTDGFVGDGFHPGSILQGILAQAVVGEVNTLYGSTVVTPITDAQIVSFAEDSQSSISLASSTTTAMAGQTIMLNADVTPGSTSNPSPTGTVTFETLTNGTPQAPELTLGTVPLSAAGTANLAVKNLPSGTYEVAAIYNGDEFNDARLSSTFMLTVNNNHAASSTSLFSSANPASSNHAVTLTADVNVEASGYPTPSGVVTFRDQTTNRVLGTGTLNAHGVATLSVSGLRVGAHSIVAMYGGTSTVNGSTSTVLVLQVAKAQAGATSTVLTPVYQVLNGRTLVTLQVTVTPLQPGGAVPGGSVKVVLGAYQVRTLALNGGKAAITLPLSLLARRTVSASYAGDSNDSASGSPAVFINPRPFRGASVTEADRPHVH